MDGNNATLVVAEQLYKSCIFLGIDGGDASKTIIFALNDGTRGRT